jgi:4'-phosphopantetheinyl transferase
MFLLYSKISEHFHENIIEKYLNYFDKDFQKKVLSYKRWQDMQLSLLGRVLLLKIFEENGISIDEISNIHYNEFGKPYLKGNPIFFNVSHSGNIVVCAFSEEFEIGIDVESFNHIDIDDFKSQMTHFEWDRIFNSDDKIQAFFKYWTQKEAILKAHGKGLMIPLKSFEVIDDKAIINDETFFTFEIYITENYICNLAIKSNLINLNDVTIKEFFI